MKGAEEIFDKNFTWTFLKHIGWDGVRRDNQRAIYAKIENWLMQKSTIDL